MQIESKYLSKHLHELAVEQLADKYAQEGYLVARDVRLGSAEADLVVSKADKHIIVEVKSPRNRTESGSFRSKMLSLRTFALENPSYSLQLVVATEPRPKKIKVEGLSDALFENLAKNPVPALNALATPYRVEKVIEVEVNELNLLESGDVQVAGTGVVVVAFRIAPSVDNGHTESFTTRDHYPFDFQVRLNHVEREGLAIREVNYLDIDTSSFYD